jgi:uncharacterized membrane protein
MGNKGKTSSSRALPGERPYGSPQKPAMVKRRKQSEIQQAVRNVTILAVVGVIVVVGLVAFSNNNPSNGFVPTAPPPQEGASVVQIPTSGISTTATFYTYNSNGVNVRYFIVRDGSNQIRLATDACDVCWAAKRGYHQTGSVMTCNNCGQTFAITSLGTSNTGGGCWPSYLPYAVNGAYVEIAKSSLDGKRPKFA